VAAAQTVLRKEGNRLVAADRCLTRVSKWVTAVAAFAGGVMMAIAVIEVIGHAAFRYSIPMGTEFIEELNVVLVFFAIAYVARERGHIRITVLEPFMPLIVRRIFKLLGYVMGILIFSFECYASGVYGLYAYSVPLEKFGVIDFVRWPFIAVVFAGCALLVIMYVLLIALEIRAWSKGGPIPAL
jgi:TRAP-type C4-dicarboxylate transport system permease small subunit